jgi:hypothetical protein
MAGWMSSILTRLELSGYPLHFDSHMSKRAQICRLFILVSFSTVQS